MKGSQITMGLQQLKVRLEDRGYKNWLKAGQCLVMLKDGLHPFINNHMRSFHGDLINRHVHLRRRCEGSCSPRQNKLFGCKVCSEWQRVILSHLRQSDATVNWGNCSPPSWRQDHWELAKAYMPRGLMRVRGWDQCDASALLNLINSCDHFSHIDIKSVREVIRCRNELMHSCEMRMSDEWMSHYHASLETLVEQFRHVPDVSAAMQQINEMLRVDWSVCVSGLDQTDTTAAAAAAALECDSDIQWKASGDSISQWEAELLRERLQELLHNAETQDTEQLRGLRTFLQNNSDLGELFSAELQTISSLEDRV